MIDTIFALSSGQPPAAIGIVRISGPRTGAALKVIAGSLPPPRVATLRSLRDQSGDLLDRALVLWFPGPHSATGEDCAELHCHGGRAVIAAVLSALGSMESLRAAEAGEFTRRAFANGQIDLAQAEALGDLLAAETELQRRVAQAGVGGALSSEVATWRAEVLALSALVEAQLDFAGEDDNDNLDDAFERRLADLIGTISRRLDAPRGERLRDGVRVVIAGPPNSGKSSLFNALLGEGAAIVSPLAGTTRDVIERPVAFGGVPFVLVDTAGLREEGADEIESVGISRAHEEMTRADLILWLGPQDARPGDAIDVQSRSDDLNAARKVNPDFAVSSVTGVGLKELIGQLERQARTLVPGPGSTAINSRQATLLSEVVDALKERSADMLILGENLRTARRAFDRLLGHCDTEHMLDALFGRFCIGK